MPPIAREIWAGTGSGTWVHETNDFEVHLYARAAGGGRGGDLHCLYAIGDSGLRVAVADVMGHGPRVGRLGTWMLRAFTAALQDPDDGAVLGTVNAQLCDRPRRVLTTAVVLGLDRRAGVLSWANAGHLPILLHREDGMGWRVLWQTEPGRIAGMPLGTRADTGYFERRDPLRAGDRLVVLTDGAVDTCDGRSEAFGFDRLRALLQDHRHRGPGALLELLVSALSRYSPGPLDHDDVTMMVVGVR